MNERRESPAGLHRYGTYRDCPYKYWLAYALGLRPKTKIPALSFGIAMHEALAIFCETGSFEQAREKAILTLEADHEQYESEDSWRLDCSRAPLLLQTWVETYGKSDREEYEILGTEMEIVAPLGPPEEKFQFTCRLDRVYRERRNGNVYIVESKTTGWSADKMWDKTARSDQIAGQIWAASRVHPEWECHAALVDVLYQRTAKGKVVGLPVCSRGAGPVYKNKQDLVNFELNLFGTVLEIAQKVKAANEGVPVPLLFPRHKNFSSLYGCEFRDICDANLCPGDTVPGFERDPWVSEEELANLRIAQNWKLEDVVYAKRSTD